MPQTAEFLADLDALTDDELRAVLARSQQLLDQHDQQRKKAALEQAKKLLSSVGLSLDGKPVKAKKTHPKKEVKETE